MTKRDQFIKYVKSGGDKMYDVPEENVIALCDAVEEYYK